jgi:hypothetical protein
LLSQPFNLGTLTCAAGLGLACYVDMAEAGYPAWFRGLRIVLTTVAVASLAWALLCRAALGVTRPDKVEVAEKATEDKKAE